MPWPKEDMADLRGALRDEKSDETMLEGAIRDAIKLRARVMILITLVKKSLDKCLATQAMQAARGTKAAFLVAVTRLNPQQRVI